MAHETLTLLTKPYKNDKGKISVRMIIALSLKCNI